MSKDCFYVHTRNVHVSYIAFNKLIKSLKKQWALSKSLKDYSSYRLEILGLSTRNNSLVYHFGKSYLTYCCVFLYFLTNLEFFQPSYVKLWNRMYQAEFSNISVFQLYIINIRRLVSFLPLLKNNIFNATQM